jgi:hypothetical protein
MPNRRKYSKGELVTSIGDAANAIIAEKCLYLNHKCQNFAWLQNMSLRTLNQYVSHARVWYAVENKEASDA